MCGPKPMLQHGRPRLSRARTRPVAAMAVLSTRSGQLYQGPPAAVAVVSKPMAFLSSFINKGRFIKVEDQASGRNGQIARFGLRMADFILPRIRSLSAAKPSHFYQGLAKRLAVLLSGRFIKGDGRFRKAGQPQ